MRTRRVWLSAALGAVVSVLCSAGSFADQRIVTSSGKAAIAGEVTLDQARREALNQARARAVEQASGVSVSSVAILQDNLMVGELVKTFSQGFIVGERNTVWSGTWSGGHSGDPGYPVVEVKLDAVVDVRSSQFFRNDALVTMLDKQTYRSGESAKLSVEARRDVRLLIVNYTSTGTIVPIFPQSEQVDTLLRSGAKRDVPSHLDPVEWEIVLRSYPGHARDVEAFLVFGLPPESAGTPDSWSAWFPVGKELPYAVFFERLLNLKPQWLAQDTLIYSVVPN